MSMQKAEMTVERIENGQYVEQVAYPFVEYEHVTMENGMDIMSMIRDDVSTPMVTHNTTSWKVGQGDSDVSETIVDSSVASMAIKGQTYQNILPSPSLRNSMANGKTMQKLNEGYDSVNTVDGVCKSAILKGCTLVNNLQKISLPKTYSDIDNLDIELSFKINANEVWYVYINAQNVTSSRNYLGLLGDGSWQSEIAYYKDGLNKLKITSTSNEATHLRIAVGGGNTINSVVLMKEDVDFVNQFWGIQSVKMPVLTTTGKNMLDTNQNLYVGYDLIGISDDNDNSYRKTQRNFIKKGTYTITCNNEDYVIRVLVSSASSPNVKTFDSANSGANYRKSVKLTLDEDSLYVINFKKNITGEIIDEINLSMLNVQTEESPTATTYEPYKSNILSTPSDLELRGIGDVKDTLDCLTGELTQRIGEIVLDGSEDWEKRGNTNSFWTYNGLDNLHCVNSQTTINCLCDMMESKTFKYAFDSTAIPNSNVGVVGCSGNKIAISFGSTTSKTLEQFKQELSLNPITVQYELETPTIKTVDLSILDQDNQPVAQLNSFANGYIQVSSQGLIPSVDYEVPTSNSYYVDLMKANTQYTMKNMQGTFTIDGIQYNASANGTFASPSTLTNKFMITSVAQSQPMLLEGDMTSKEVPYVEGNKSTFEGADNVEIVSQNADNTLSNTTSFQLSNPLRSLPNGVRDEIVLDRVNHKAKIIQRVGEDLTQLDTPFVTEVNLEGYPYVYKGGHIFLNTEIAPTTEVTYSINQAHQIESSNEDILRHQNEINHLYELIAQYVQVQYEAELIDIALQG